MESLLFSQCLLHDMPDLVDVVRGIAVPSRAFNEGGIHERSWHMRIRCFMKSWPKSLPGGIWNWKVSLRETPEGMVDLNRRIDAYLDEFEAHGTDNLTVEGVE